MSGLDEVIGSARDRKGGEIDLHPVRALIGKIVARWDPHQIWLFGSRARGEANEWSDWDLLVVVPDETPDEEFDPKVAYALRRDTSVAADVILTPRAEFEDYRNVTCTLQYEAAHFGVLLYAR